jgi:hypothetical protein
MEQRVRRLRTNCRFLVHPPKAKISAVRIQTARGGNRAAIHKEGLLS